MTTYENAASYLAAGLSTVPVKRDGTKAAARAWKVYQQRQPNDSELAEWHKQDHQGVARYGIAIVCGPASRGLEVLDFDETDLISDFRKMVEDRAPGLLTRLPTVQTPRPGLQLYYRCAVIGGNEKLAEREIEVQAKTPGSYQRDGRWFKLLTLIETRGHGGYVVAPGSPLDCHPTGRPYKVVNSYLTAIPEISTQERDVLLSCARAQNEHVKPATIIGAPVKSKTQGELRPGDDFNQRGDVRALLKQRGWSFLKSAGSGREHWARPGVKHTSATLFDNGVLYVFSTNAHPFDNNRAYSPFAVYATLEHDGDFDAATKALAKEGYGEQRHKNGNGKAAEVSIETLSDVDGWPTPKPLPDALRPVPALPPALIPAALRKWLADIAERLQVPLEFPAVAALVLLASVIGNQIRVRPKRRDDWMVTPNLWGAIIGRPGVMKSPAIAEPMKAIYRLVKEAEEEHQKALRDWRFSKEAAEAKKAARRDKLKKAAKAGKDLEQFRAELEEGEEEEPTERRYVVNDTTVEKYGELLNQNPNGLLIFRDELTGWLRSLDDERRANDRAFFLEAWNGDGSYTYDRIGRGTLKIENITTSIFGGIQPGPLESYLRNALGYGEGDDGLMQRIQMMVYPDITGEWRNVDRWPRKEAKNQAFETYKYLSEIDPESIGAEIDEQGRAFVTFDPQAQELFSEWLTDLNRSLRSGAFEHPALEAHFSKYKSLMPTLALILHLCDVADGNSASAISLTNAEMAAAWCEFLTEHAKRIYGLGMGAAAIHARTLANHLEAGELPEVFTARELYLKHWAGLATAKAVEEPLDLLESLGWLRSVNIQTGGRPSIHYLVNPKIGGSKQ